MTHGVKRACVRACVRASVSVSVSACTRMNGGLDTFVRPWYSPFRPSSF